MQQRLVLMLSVNIYQQRGKLLYLLCRYVLTAYLYGGDTANNAKALAATTGWDNHNNGDDICSPNQNQNLNNATGFSALPAGAMYYYQDHPHALYAPGSAAKFWTSTQYTYDYARQISVGMACSVINASQAKYMTYSVRCLRDAADEANNNLNLHDSLATVAFTGNYSDLNGAPTIPTVNDATLTIMQDGQPLGTFSANSCDNQTINITSTDITGLQNQISNQQRLIDSLRNAMTDVQRTLNEVNFQCGTSKMIDADGNQYNTVKIGNQCWTKTNLRVAAGTRAAVYSTTEPYYHVDTTMDAATYGYYYNWNAAMSACPSGWNLPSRADFQTLMDSVSHSSSAQSTILDTIRQQTMRQDSGQCPWDIIPYPMELL